MAAIRVQVHPRSHRVVVKIVEDVVHIWVHAPPVEGAANEAVIEVLAETVEVPRSSLSIQRGASARYKQIHCDMLTQEELWTRLRKKIEQA